MRSTAKLGHDAACAAAVFLALGIPLAADAAQDGARTADYRNPRYGFHLTFPADVFVEDAAQTTDSGRMFVSGDGRARLLAGALENTDGFSVATYRDFVLHNSYPGSKLDYAPLRRSWFVLSGVRDAYMFYERVTFTCAGRIINSWAMVYPVAERRRYDPIVEQVARSYKAGEDACR